MSAFEAQCPNCARELTVDEPGLNTCPNCDHVVDIAAAASTKPRQTVAPQMHKRKQLSMLVVLPVILISLWGIGVIVEKIATPPGATYQRTSAPPRRELEDAHGAILKAQEAVKGRLKAPSTAKFPDPFGPEYRLYSFDDGSTAECVGVTSWVESQNSFGAQLRTEWVVELKRDATRRWELKKVEIAQ